MRTLALVAVLALVFAAATYACPASYVHGVAQQNQGNQLHGKMSQVADQYLTRRGVDPQSPSGQVVKPYVVGTGIVETQWHASQFNAQWGVPQLVDAAIGSYTGPLQPNNHPDNQGHGNYDPAGHFNLHAGYGLQQAGGSQPPQVTTDKKGG